MTEQYDYDQTTDDAYARYLDRRCRFYRNNCDFNPIYDDSDYASEDAY